MVLFRLSRWNYRPKIDPNSHKTRHARSYTKIEYTHESLKDSALKWLL